MKKSRDDVFTVPPQHEGPGVSSRAEPSGHAQKSTASSAQKLTTNDALSYLKAVKENFEDKKDKYNDFLDVMKDFKAQRIETSGVILKVKELFKGNRDLILGFNTFLPKGYEITLPLEDEPLFKKKPVDFEEAISFVNKIKIRFQGDDHVYKAFLDILNMYRKDNKSITDVYREVSVLFQDHADLLGEFKHFLPNTTGAASIVIAPSGKNNVLRQNDRGTPMAMARTNHVEKKPAVSYAVRDQNVDHPVSERLNPVGKEYEKREDRDKSEWENDEDDSLDHKRKYARRDDSLTEQFHQGRLRPVLTLCDKVKERLQNTKDYKKFLDCVRSYGSKFLTTPQFQKLVTDLLGRHPDLMEECGNYINYVEKNGFFPNNKQQSRSLKVEDRNGDNPDSEDRDGKDDNNKERDTYDRGLAFNARDVPGQKQSAVREKYLAKPVQELDLSNCESCTPSYRLLPDDYPIPKASWRTKIGAEVLNDCWVSVTSGSEDYSFKNMRKNQYEESLFRCEDDRFELDMLLESVNSTAKRVEELLDSMDADTCKTDNPFHVNDHLTALDLRCIERLYGDHGLDVMDVLKKNALLALPIILTRLKQKQEEWARCRLDFGKVWAEIYAKNYHKSLDHRSFYFKQQDTKNLSPKAMISEIKEMSENNQNEDEMILSIGAGYRQPIKPHMEFEYPDCDIHEDIYQLMKNSCGEMCTPEQHDKIMKIWTTFLEQVLGVPWRPPNSEDIENIIKTNNHVTEIVSNIGEKNGNHIGEAASENCKSSDTSKNEKICSSRVLLANGNDGVNDDGSPDSDNIASGGAHTGLMQPDAYMSSAVPGASKETGFSDQGADGVNVDCQLKVISHEESHSQDGVSGKHTSSSTGTVYEEIKTQNCHEETEGRSTSDREEGELSPNQNVGENNFAEYGNYGTKPAHDHRKESRSARTEGEEMCIQEAGINTVANGDDEAVESAHCSSDSENASENGEMSGSESADGEERSPEEPDEDAGQEENNNSTVKEGEAELHGSDGVIASSDCSLLTLKPLTMETHPSLRGKEKNSEIFYGSDSFYLLFKLHQMLYERMQSAKLHSSSPESKWRIPNGSNPEDSYARFKDALYNLLNGSSDNAKFEDDCRAIIGAQSYILFTLDKLIHRLVKQLQTIAGEEIDSKLLQLYVYERSRIPGKFADAVYHENARFLLPEDNLYRIECLPSSMRLTIQLMKTEHDKPEPTAVSMDPTFAAYLNNELLSVVPERKEKEKPRIFVKRNKRKVLTKYGVSDACNAMDGLITYNGLEIKVASSTFKVAYVLDTEDFLYRRGKRRKTLGDNDLCNGASKRFSRLMVS